jgi:hypothetical protein
VSPSTVSRIWRAHGLKPHLVRTFKLSNDPLFAEKLHDIVGLYVNPPEHAVVLCADEKSQIQALDRTQPGLPIKRWRAGTMTEWLKYLRLIDKSVSPELNIHLIAGNCSTHKHDKVQRWLKRHPRFQMHFTPTSSSWLNMVERFFRDITTQAIRRGAFRSVDKLISAIEVYSWSTTVTRSRSSGPLPPAIPSQRSSALAKF